MADNRFQIKETDRYDPTRNSLLVCSYCGAPVAKAKHSITVGMCIRHEGIFKEDIKKGLHLQNRLRDLIFKSNQ